MPYEIDYLKGEKEGFSCMLTVEDRIFYVKTVEAPQQITKYYAGDKTGVFKEISKNEFNFWLSTLVDEESDVEEIKRRICLGRKYQK